MQSLPNILSLFRNSVDKFNMTGAEILEFLYHMTLKLFSNHIFGLKTLGFRHMRDIKITIL